MPTITELIQKEIKELEDNLLLIEERKSQYVLSTDIPLSLVKDEKHQRDKLEQLRVRLKSREEASPARAVADPLSIAQKIKNTHVNRDEEIALFRDMIERHSKFQLLLIEAESGMGKSALLRQFTVMSEEHCLPHAKVDLKNPRYKFGEIFLELQHQLGELSFSDFDDQCRRFLAELGLTVARSASPLSSVDDAMKKLSEEDRIDKRQVLIDAFFGELATFHDRDQRSIVLMFDTYDKANPLVKEWINKQFIIRCRLFPWIVVVVAGQKTPNIDLKAELWLHSKLTALNEKHIETYLHRLKLTQEDVIVKFITSTLPDESMLKSMQDDYLKWFIKLVFFKTEGIPEYLRALALDIATRHC